MHPRNFFISPQGGSSSYIKNLVPRVSRAWNGLPAKRCYSFPTLELVQANKPDIVLLDHQQKTMFVIEFSAPAEVNIVSKEEEKRTKYQELIGQLRRLWPDNAVSLLVMVIGSLGGMRNTLLSALRAIPVCRAAAHILAARMQKADLETIIQGSVLYAIKQEVPKRALGSNEQPAKNSLIQAENMIWDEHVSSIATVAGKKLRYLFRTRKYFSPLNLLTLYKAQKRPSLEYCSHVWGADGSTT
nr:unnamed protein product [Callosobruchus chinensis]